MGVLNVINAVFVQHTMKVASDSNDVKIMLKQEEQEAYQKQLRALFKSMDISGDNKITMDEIERLMDDPSLKAWFEAWFLTMDMNIKDMVSLFEMYDDGDGELTADEFLAGAPRLKGNAKNIDMAKVMIQIGRIEGHLKTLL